MREWDGGSRVEKERGREMVKMKGNRRNRDGKKNVHCTLNK